MPQDFNFKQIDQSIIQLKWSYNINILKHIRNTGEYPSASDDSKSMSKTNKFDNFYFYLYLNKTNRDDQSQQPTTPTPTLQLTSFSSINRNQYNIHSTTTPYLIISAAKANLQDPHTNNIFIYNLTNLLPNSQYIFYLSARYELLESSLAGPLVIQTPGESFHRLLFGLI
jgi:hypothetical protein